MQAADSATRAHLVPVSFADLHGFATDDHKASWAAFLPSCRAIMDNRAELRKGTPASPKHRDLCARAIALGAEANSGQIRAFFETNFAPHLISPGNDPAFLTAYYRPEVQASLTPTAEFTEPLLARPDDLITLHPGQVPPEGTDLLAGRIGTHGKLESYPTRAEIDAGALGAQARPLAYVADGIEAFMIHVQGSARLRLPDGKVLDLTYAGRNGRPYVSIGKILIGEGEISLQHMSLDMLKGWVRAHGQALGQDGRGLLHRNPSFIFFSATPADDESPGPIAAAGLPLTPFRSLAIDRSIWAYGLPFWIDADLPWQTTGTQPFARLMIGQDTGSAIVGPARADLYFGTGATAGQRAGDIRHHARMYVLLPVGEAP